MKDAENRHLNVTSHLFKLTDPFSRHVVQDVTLTSRLMTQHPKKKKTTTARY